MLCGGGCGAKVAFGYECGGGGESVVCGREIDRKGQKKKSSGIKLFVAGFYVDSLQDVGAFEMGLPNKAETARLYHKSAIGAKVAVTIRAGHALRTVYRTVG